MSFNLLETSVFGGSPIELYEFGVLGQTWRYTTDDRITTFNGAEFQPVSDLSRSSIKVTQVVEKGEVRITMRGNVPVAEQFLAAPPSEPMQVRIYKKHRNDPDYIIRWRGRVMACAWEGASAVLICSSVNSSLKQPGLRRSFQYACPHDLYGIGCGVARNDFEVIGTVVSLTGLVMTLTLPTTYATDYFAGGYLLWENETGRQDTRMITASSGATVTVQNSTIGLFIGSTLRLYPGCDHSPQTCFAKFNNIDNHGGFPFIPTTNPFAGATIF
jgi:uncharacterized phage protein (TIGR02218 family)